MNHFNFWINSSILSDIENTTCIDLINNTDVIKYLQKIKIVINTSYYEGYSNVLVEAINKIKSNEDKTNNIDLDVNINVKLGIKSYSQYL